MNIFSHKLAIVLVLVLSAAAATPLFGQEKPDSVVIRRSALMDSTLAGKSIFNLLAAEGSGGATATVHQSDKIRQAFASHIASNPSKSSTGFRVRIFNDNKQTSRNDSQTALARFEGMFPGIPAYRTYSNPFFRVTVGDFRTRSEAMHILQQVKSAFPTAFIVKETIGYPVVDRHHSYTVETVETDNQE